MRLHAWGLRQHRVRGDYVAASALTEAYAVGRLYHDWRLTLRGGGARMLKPVPDDFLQRWPVSKRVNSSKADADDPTLIERVELATA